MPQALFVVPVENNVPIILLEEGESLEYSVGFMDVWRDTVTEEYTGEWIDFDGWWPDTNVIKVDPVYIDDDLDHYLVTRRNLTNVEAFRGGWVAQSTIPPDLPPDTTLIAITTTEARIDELDARLRVIDAGLGRYGEITADG